jgi:transcriptional regulator with XRE-family HTH domain
VLIGVFAVPPYPAASVRNLGSVPSRNGVRGEIRQFLTTRRARITPEQAGLPDYGGRRRVPGLRREEVALLAGISIEYYTRLERGDARGVSQEVLDGIARALQLDDVERAHLAHLVRTVNATRPARRRPTQQRVRPSVQRVLDSMISTAAFVRNGRLDILSANYLGYALYAPAFLDPVRPVNLAGSSSLTGARPSSTATGMASRRPPSAACGRSRT